jgi:hypothetical protein
MALYAKARFPVYCLHYIVTLRPEVYTAALLLMLDMSTGVYAGREQPTTVRATKYIAEAPIGDSLLK